jgi:hypothetical protein
MACTVHFGDLVVAIISEGCDQRLRPCRRSPRSRLAQPPAVRVVGEGRDIPQAVPELEHEPGPWAGSARVFYMTASPPGSLTPLRCRCRRFVESPLDRRSPVRGHAVSPDKVRVELYRNLPARPLDDSKAVAVAEHARSSRGRGCPRDLFSLATRTFVEIRHPVHAWPRTFVASSQYSTRRDIEQHFPINSDQRLTAVLFIENHDRTDVTSRYQMHLRWCKAITPERNRGNNGQNEHPPRRHSRVPDWKVPSERNGMW